ncbi:hypothetical protein SY87_03035 [Burkholderia pseudomallei]|nr:hypothetical protein SY87_03035 [Burkholderia pseudomallei]
MGADVRHCGTGTCATAHRPPPTAHRPPPTAHQPPTTNHQPPTTNHQPPTTNHQPPTTNHQPPTTVRHASFPLLIRVCAAAVRVAFLVRRDRRGRCLNISCRMP